MSPLAREPINFVGGFLNVYSHSKNEKCKDEERTGIFEAQGPSKQEAKGWESKVTQI